MAFHFIRPSIRTKDILNCLRTTLQNQNITLGQRQNLRFSAEKLVESQRCYTSVSNSRCKIQLVCIRTGRELPLLKLRNCGLNKGFKRLKSEGGKASRNNMSAALYIGSFGVIMLGAAYLGIPLYRMFCQAFGVGGESAYNTKQLEKTKKIEDMKKVEDRLIKVVFLADVAATMKWDFRPQQNQVQVAPGETALAFYTAKNPTDKPIVGISTYSVLPNKAAKYFNKIQCFCFEEQILNPHEQVDMPVFFYIDPEIDEDIYVEDLDTLILSYTFFEAKEGMTLPMPGFS